MLTLKLINEETERVIRGLEKKHFAGAKEAIDNGSVLVKAKRFAPLGLKIVLVNKLNIETERY